MCIYDIAQIVITFVYYLHIVHLFNFFLSIVFARTECSVYIYKNIYNKKAYHVVLVLCFYISFFLLLLASVSTSLTKSNNKQFILNQINFGKIFTRWSWWTNNNNKIYNHPEKKFLHHIKIQFTYKICAMKYI